MWWQLIGMAAKGVLNQRGIDQRKDFLKRENDKLKTAIAAKKTKKPAELKMDILENTPKTYPAEPKKQINILYILIPALVGIFFILRRR